MEGEGIESRVDTVFIAEDDEDLLRTYELWLSARGDVEVDTAVDGEVALEAMDEETDVLVLDRDLPGLAGPELVESLSVTDISVVVVSAYEPDRHLGRDDVARYLVKPVGQSALLDALDDVLS